MTLNGLVIGHDLPSAQQHVLSTFHSLEVLRDVQSASLSPLTNPQSLANEVRLPFEVRLDVNNPIPGGR